MSDEDEKAFFEGFLENLSLAIAQLKDESVQRPQTTEKFDGAIFWNRINSTSKVISSSCTKLCLAYSEAPFPLAKECRALYEGVLNGVLAILTDFYALPKAQGLSLQKQTRHSVVQIVESVLHLIDSISQDVRSLKHQLHSTGSVWEKCEEFATLPKDSREAVLVDLTKSSSLVKDALEELEEAVQNETTDMFDDFAEVGLDGDDSLEPSMPAWSEKDKEILAPCQGLVKASKACLKRVSTAVRLKGQCDCGESVAQLDDIGEKAKGVSPLVDEVVSSLYPPLAYSVVRYNVDRLSIHLEALLDYTRQSHVTSDDDVSWLDFLLKAIVHNRSKVHDLIPST